MNFLAYLSFRVFQGLVAILPFRVLYAFSDVFAFLMHHIVRYRYKVIEVNLRNAFPNKGSKEIKKIIHLYYRNLGDVFLESIKGYSVNTSEMLNRYYCLNPEVSNAFFAQGKDVIFAMSHYGNWEWGTQVAAVYFNHSVISFYKPLSNKYIDRFIFQNRNKHKMALESIYKTKFIFRSHSEKPKAYFLLSDQSPSNRKTAYWVNFLNQDTACLHGIESYARLFNIPVVYLDVQRIRRGFYTVELDLICANPQETVTGEITQKYMQKLEGIITQRPEGWLWSHRRWKMKKPVVQKSEKLTILSN